MRARLSCNRWSSRTIRTVACAAALWVASYLVAGFLYGLGEMPREGDES
jgi:hypothetical protein